MVETGKSTREEYVRLTEHTTLQFVIFVLLTLAGSSLTFIYCAIPILELFFQGFLDAQVLKSEGLMEYISWKVFVSSANGTENIYELDPLLSFAPFVLVVGLGLAFYTTALLSPHWGLIYQKIQREIVNALDKIARIIYHENVEEDHREVEQRLIELDTRHLHELAAIHRISFDELSTLKRALIWRKLTGLSKLLNVHDGIRLYMRNYFTQKYGNGMLGIVYIGAAVLIVVIGLRGLKFIPASAPSVVIFALGLEFVLLIIYAITVIYTKDEEGQGITRESHPESDPTVKVLQSISTTLQSMAGDNNGRSSALPMGGAGEQETVNTREVENLLRVFLNRPRERR